FNAFGHRVSLRNKLGGTTTYTYNARGLLASEVLPISSYTNSGSVQATSVTTSYAYDSRGNLITKTEAAGLTEQRVTQYEYDGADRLIKIKHDVANTQLVSSATAAAATSGTQTLTEELKYDRRGNVIEKIDAAGARTLYWYDKADRVTHSLSPTGTLTRTYYDKNGNVAETRVYETIETLPSDALGIPPSGGSGAYRITQYQYDALDRLTKTITPSITIGSYTSAFAVATQNLETTYEYDAMGNVVRVTDPKGAQTYSYYNAAGRKIAEIDAGLYRTDWTYDSEGNVLTERRYKTAQSSAPSSITASPPSAPSTHADDRVTEFTYDKMGRRLTQTRKDVVVHSTSTPGTTATQDSTIAYQYDALGNVTRKTEATGDYIDYDYDLGGRLTREERSAYTDFNGASVAPAVDYYYDGLNNLARSRSAGSTYAGGGAIILRQEVPLSDPSWTTFRASGSVLLGGNAEGKHAVTAGATISYSFYTKEISDTALRVDAFIDFWDASGNYLSRVAQTYTQAPSGFVQVTGSGTAPTGAAFAAVGVLAIRENTTDNSAMEIAIKDFSFNGGSVVATPTAIANWSNGTGRNFEVRRGDVDERVTTYEYYSNGGLLKTKTDAEGFAQTYRYDKADRLLRAEYVRSAADSSTTNDGVGYAYDLEGRVTQQGVMLKESGGTYTRTGFDTATTQYNAYGDISQRGLNSVYSELFAYDKAGRVWRSTEGDGTTKYYMYDAAGNRTLTIASDGTNIDNQTLTWALDRWGSTRADIGTVYVDGVVSTITKYDARNQAIEVREPRRELTSSTKADLVTSRAYNAFGEVAYEINALSARIDYTYNTMGRLIQRESPSVEGVGENGKWISGYSGDTPNASSTTAVTFRPIEKFYYDKSGRLVANRDANGNLTRQVLLAGTGYNGTNALVTQVITPDNEAVTTAYDIHGDARRIVDQLKRPTTQSFDKLGRIVQMSRPGGLVESYAYDGLGQRIRRWNNQLGTGTNKEERITYDQQGRITQQIAMGGDTTSYAYSWSGSLATTGMATYGGWTKTTTYANSKTLIEKTDVFGRTLQRTDLGSHVSDYTYDKAGRLITRSGGDTLYSTYFNTNKIASAYGTFGYQDDEGSWKTQTTTYSYDAVGNLTREKIHEVGENYWSWAYDNGKFASYGVETEPFDHVVRDSTATYDALSRLLTWSDSGSAAPPASITYSYDAASNIRRSLSTFRVVTDGVVASSSTTQDFWYRYDSLNRVVTQKGQLSGGAVVRSTQGTDVFYDAAGQR
ncbi:MAG: hypothetical protein ABW199_01285, partial [Caulobacterales bacterium]